MRGADGREAREQAVVKIVELGAGLLLLGKRFVPLALALLAPFIVGIAAFHILLAPAGMGIVIAFVALELLLAWSYRSAFRPMLRARVTADPILAGAPAARRVPEHA